MMSLIAQLPVNTKSSVTPITVAYAPRTVQVILNNYTSFAKGADGTLWGWGWNAKGGLGMNDTSDRWVATKVVNYACGNNVCESNFGEDVDTCAADCAKTCTITSCDACGANVITDCNICGSHLENGATVCDTCPNPGACLSCSIAHKSCGAKP